LVILFLFYYFILDLWHFFGIYWVNIEVRWLLIVDDDGDAWWKACDIERWFTFIKQ
jgi:hypothetical protein